MMMEGSSSEPCGGDEAPQRERHAVLVAGRADDAQHHAVMKSRTEGSQPEDDAAGKGDKADR